MIENPMVMPEYEYIYETEQEADDSEWRDID